MLHTLALDWPVPSESLSFVYQPSDLKSEKMYKSTHISITAGPAGERLPEQYF